MEAASTRALTNFEQLTYAREILQLEGEAILRLGTRLNLEFCRAVELLRACRGTVIVSGIGKAGLIGQKVSATLCSTGTRSIFLHPAEAVHGDLGRVAAEDVVLMLSQSGETEEVTRLLPALRRIGVSLIALTARETSTLGKAATVTIALGPLKEACSLGLAPSTSTTAMLAMGDALALVTSRLLRFDRADFARVHPGGALGRELSRVEDQMRQLVDCRIASESHTLREVFADVQRPGRRSGAIMLVDGDDALSGIFTDSDLARLFETRRYDVFDHAISEVMTRRPCTVPLGSMLVDAVAIMAERKISELPVVDAHGKPAGLLDITDMVSMIPDASR
jgi:arabinose-5-phosphate isomerase